MLTCKEQEDGPLGGSSVRGQLWSGHRDKVVFLITFLVLQVGQQGDIPERLAGSQPNGVGTLYLQRILLERHNHGGWEPRTREELPSQHDRVRRVLAGRWAGLSGLLICGRLCLSTKLVWQVWLDALGRRGAGGAMEVTGRRLLSAIAMVHGKQGGAGNEHELMSASYQLCDKSKLLPFPGSSALICQQKRLDPILSLYKY